MLIKSNCQTPFLVLLKGNCNFLKGIISFRYSPFAFVWSIEYFIKYYTDGCSNKGCDSTRNHIAMIYRPFAYFGSA